MDTGANVTMSRRQFFAFLDANLNVDYIEVPFGGLEVKLVGKPCRYPVLKLGFRLKLPPPGQSPRARGVSYLGK